MQKYILIILLLLAACSGKKEIIDDRYIVFNVYSYKYVCPHSIILNFKDKTICIHNITNEISTIEDIEITSNEDENRIEEKKLYKKPPLAIVKDNMIVDSLGILFIKVRYLCLTNTYIYHLTTLKIKNIYIIVITLSLRNGIFST